MMKMKFLSILHRGLPLLLGGCLAMQLNVALGQEATQDEKPKAEESKADAPKEGEAKRPTLSETPWIKVCNDDKKINKNVCLIVKEKHTRSGQLISSFTIREIAGDKKKLIAIALPPGLLLPPGVKVQIDENKASLARYSICYANLCYAQLLATKEFIDALKRGGKVFISSARPQGGSLDLSFDLTGFTKSYDGDPIDPKLLQSRLPQQQEDSALSQKLKAKAEEKRQKLLEEGKTE